MTSTVINVKSLIQSTLKAINHKESLQEFGLANLHQVFEEARKYFVDKDSPFTCDCIRDGVLEVLDFAPIFYKQEGVLGSWQNSYSHLSNNIISLWTTLHSKSAFWNYGLTAGGVHPEDMFVERLKALEDILDVLAEMIKEEAKV